MEFVGSDVLSLVIIRTGRFLSHYYVNLWAISIALVPSERLAETDEAAIFLSQPPRLVVN